ncbi:tRNA (uridine(34)/cytosine(34)/5-carboxymethylaminomethyluridine(34)-2'-O)-methyltransferase TrmL [Legionella israelensis]|uniref:tRNA (uridine(34)/cytosine(34)/5- carboxymethylaminomethyluridine(34)-2'-O)- methyltransferase TrmL n=1 Tax=Legionella israelensis TaxID=454 RepID=UPI00117CE86A|nr:tRNA (uridine(34)/cytosine(34)/5-carboxymethylaminomethyluridine(34)-2'-O)-methyltransferase TrmL [Legionella israelensis]QDP73121.1 tRNA (uridine(34)/cytosine(34)/5-carboxymethylaminomethyluridine(34)-2'-O)-methyltransferase TrmL [Legionella israelensis]
MLHVTLYQPEIPPNTGNIIRLCANSGARLHLIHPLGFTLDDKRMRRAGLDYHEWATVIHYDSEEAFIEQNQQRRIFACSTKGNTRYTDIVYQDEDMLLFGPETRGLPEKLRHLFQSIRIPMCEQSRSLNLSNSVAIILFEAWRQCEFMGSE